MAKNYYDLTIDGKIYSIKDTGYCCHISVNSEGYEYHFITYMKSGDKELIKRLLEQEISSRKNNRSEITDMSIILEGAE